MNCVVCGRALDKKPGNYSDDICWRAVIPPASNGDYWTEEDAHVCYRLGFMRLHAENERLRKVLTRLAVRSKVAREALAAPGDGEKKAPEAECAGCRYGFSIGMDGRHWYTGGTGSNVSMDCAKRPRKP